MSLNIEDFRNVGINKLYHITYLENLDSILKNNILCKSKLNKLNINHTSHSDPEIILKRKDKHKDINNFISLFFNKNTPMLYDVKFKTDKVLILEFNIFDIHQNSKSNWDKSFFSNKNYLSLQKPILDSRQLYNYPLIIFSDTGWQSSEKTNHYKLEAQSEFLFHQEISIQSIKAIHVNNFNVQSQVETRLSNFNYMLSKKINIVMDDFKFTNGKLNDTEIKEAYMKEYERLQNIKNIKNIYSAQEESNMFRKNSHEHQIYLDKVLKIIKLSGLEINKIKTLLREKANTKYNKKFGDSNHNKLEKQKEIINLQKAELSNYLKKKYLKLKRSM